MMQNPYLALIDYQPDPLSTPIVLLSNTSLSLSKTLSSAVLISSISKIPPLSIASITTPLTNSNFELELGSEEGLKDPNKSEA
jgi:hypothetical protein